MRPLKPCLQYVGSKVLLASRIVALLPEHRSYVEPYVGSAAVLLAKEPVFVETINDYDEQLIAFYRTLRNERTRYQLIDSLTYTPYSRAELRDAVDDPSLDDVERARRFMIRTNQRYVGGGGSWTATTRGSSGHSNASKWNNYRTRLSAIAERLQNVQIECKDAVEILTRVWTAHDPSIAVYLDPPYPQQTRTGSKYLLDATDQHHQDMLAMAVRIEGPVVLSSYDSALYNEVLGASGAGWSKYEIDVRASGQSGRGSTSKRTEVLWANEHCAHPATPIQTPVQTDVAEVDSAPEAADGGLDEGSDVDVAPQRVGHPLGSGPLPQG